MSYMDARLHLSRPPVSGAGVALPQVTGSYATVATAGANPDTGQAAPAATRWPPLPAGCLAAVPPVRVLAALRTELAAHGIATTGMTATRLQATLRLPGGRTVRCQGGWLSWPEQGHDGDGGSACAVHWVGDLVGASDRLTRGIPAF